MLTFFRACVMVLMLGMVSSPLTSADERLKDIACRSVHLGYPAAEGLAFYNEITVDESAIGTYFMVCGWSKGYYGIQELGNGKKMLIFSVWDSAQDDPKAVKEDQRVKLVHKDEKVRIGRFGGEGTGGQSFLDYDWKVGQTYRFLVTATPAGQRTEYAGHFYLPEEKAWKHLVTFSTITGGKYLSGYYSFVEDFKRDRVSATKVRKAHFGNGWVLTKGSEWQALSKARFTADRNPVTNIDAGVDTARFFLATGGETKNANTPLGTEIELPAAEKRTPPEGLPGIAPSPDSLRVLDASSKSGGRFGPVYEELLIEARLALERRKTDYEQVKTAEQVRAWQQARRDFFLRQIGAFPERTPLDAKVVGRLAGDGCRIEKIRFASRPNHHVTATLYLPESKPPYPGVLVPCGHSYDGKAAAGYQRVCLLLARNGLAALCYDPIGQGERYQLFDPHGQPLVNLAPASPKNPRLAPIPGLPRFDPVEEHMQTGLGALLVGRSTAHYRIWDGMRALDYLQSRPDIDSKRLGCTGNSGGGTLTSYLMALDDRIVCAAPACYLTTFRRLLDTSGPQDAEQNVFGQLAFGMDQGDYPLMRAPKPTLLLAGTRDATFAIEGTWEVFREGKRFYSRVGFPERIELVEADEPHGFSQPLRVASVRWMRRWLLGIDDAIEEPELKVRTQEELFCTPAGQALRLPGERSVFDLNREEAERLASTRRRWSAGDNEECRKAVREAVRVRSLAELPRLTHRRVGELKRGELLIE